MKRFVLVLLLFQSFVLFAEENQAVLRELRRYGGSATFNLTARQPISSATSAVGTVLPSAFLFDGRIIA